MGFWNDVCRLRAENAIPRVWKREHLMERLSYAEYHQNRSIKLEHGTRGNRHR